MKRHRFDAISFVFGLTFIALAFGLSSSDFHLNAMRLRWLGAGFLLLLGTSMMVTSRRRRDDR